MSAEGTETIENETSNKKKSKGLTGGSAKGMRAPKSKGTETIENDTSDKEKKQRTYTGGSAKATENETSGKAKDLPVGA